MNLEKLIRLMADNGCKKVYVKKLAANDNSKNQVYLGGSFEVLNIFPISEIQAESSGNWKNERFKASINFYWIANDGTLHRAPMAQFILYPKYPEVRFSGFLTKCENAPSGLMTVREDGRLLFFSVTDKGHTLGYVTGADSALNTELEKLDAENTGVFRVFEITGSNGRKQLLSELNRIHKLNWIKAKRLDRNGGLMACDASNCGGYTLEAELGITPNGYSEPDFQGWEVKQFGVENFNRLGSATITLMTPEPTDGLYVSRGVDYFIRTYGYPDQKNRPDRLNFGGVFKAGKLHEHTRLTMQIIGFDPSNQKITNSTGRIALVDEQGNEAAAWSFTSMLKHWNKKHNQACYVPSLSKIEPVRQYYFGNHITLGINTNFLMFLTQMAIGNIYYDPGIKMENASTQPVIKRRSQFRIKSSFLGNLYKKKEEIDVASV